MNEKINIKALKHSLTSADYVAVENALGLKRFSENSVQTIFYNADAHKDITKQKPKLYGYKENHIYMSYTRGVSMDIFGLVQAIKTTAGESCSFLDAVNFVLSTIGKSQGSFYKLNKSGHVYNWEDSLGKFIRIKRGENSLKTYNPIILDQLESCPCEQWFDEGIDEEIQEKYHIGYYPRLDATTIPVFSDEGELIGIRCRHWREEEIENGKYRPLQLLDGTIYKFPTNNVFYGWNYNRYNIEDSRHAILVEGEKSVMKADKFFGGKSNVVALFGSQLGLYRRNMLIKAGVNHITIALDSDFHEIGDNEYKEFEKKILKFAEPFKGYVETIDVVYNNIGLNEYKCSPFDFDKTTWDSMWRNREIIE